jgi:hypothetical protein
MPLPEFVIIGAPRSGTTALWSWLDGHPNIQMARPKEVRFFDEHWDKGLDWYEQHFGPDPIRGEASPTYMTTPIAIERMARSIPDALLIASLRDPVDRVYSAYWQERAQGLERRSFADAIAEEERFLDPSYYLRHLRAVCDLYPRESLSVVIFEELIASPTLVYRDLCRFLGVAEIVPPVVGEKANSPRRDRSERARAMAQRFRSDRWMVRKASLLLSRLNTTATYPPMESSMRAALAERLAPENAALASWLGRELPWE